MLLQSTPRPSPHSALPSVTPLVSWSHSCAWTMHTPAALIWPSRRLVPQCCSMDCPVVLSMTLHSLVPIEWGTRLCEIIDNAAGQSIEQHCGTGLLDSQINATGVCIVHAQECDQEARGVADGNALWGDGLGVLCSSIQDTLCLSSGDDMTLHVDIGSEL